MGSLCCRPEKVPTYVYPSCFHGDILCYCDEKKTALTLRKVSKAFKAIIDREIYYDLKIEVHGDFCGPAEGMGSLNLYEFKVVPVICREICKEQKFLLGMLDWNAATKPMSDLKCSSLNLFVAADGSTDYAKMLSDLAIFFVKRPIHGLPELKHFSLDITKPPNADSSNLIFTHLRSFSNLLPKDLLSLTLNMHTDLCESLDYVRFLLDLSPKLLTYNSDQPDVHTLVSLMKENFDTLLHIGPVPAGEGQSKTMVVGYDVFLVLDMLKEAWKNSAIFHANKVTLTFRIPEEAWKSSIRTCSACISEPMPSTPDAYVTLKHSIFPESSTRLQVGHFELYMSFEDESEETGCLGHGFLELDYNSDDEEREMTEIVIEPVAGSVSYSARERSVDEARTAVPRIEVQEVEVHENGLGPHEDRPGSPPPDYDLTDFPMEEPK
ncbi:hypothetical protein QR680_006535 [Steinernema hermaphroditum]|uniref:F-box domain-containing protein n=1 Tax=Steinernema hermaphroditum TaxID=289476 RepID=A0AA39HX92_9BILA|nr:hypothetical protein QR680_006535 [Steinernema hermaphroditum]